jgi:hypothetical protein
MDESNALAVRREEEKGREQNGQEIQEGTELSYQQASYS